MEFENISNFSDVSDLMYIFVAILTIDVVVLFLARYNKTGGKYLNEWYDQFNILAVLVDVMVIFIGFIITRYIYTNLFFDKFGWNPIFFMLLLVVIQLLHDSLFYFGALRNIPLRNNEMIDVLKKYAEDLGGVIYGGDALVVIASAVVAMFYESLPTTAFISVGSVVVYSLPYILFTKNPYIALAEKEIKEAKAAKEAKKPAFEKIDAYNRLL
jgi:hypothetical protein